MTSSSSSERAGLLLASSSPRRKELLALLTLPFSVWPSGVDEQILPGESAETAVARLAAAKAQAGASQGETFVIGADTMVVLPGGMLAKPATPDEATAMLRTLRGREHRVVTGVAVAHGSNLRCRARTTRVFMRNYSDAEIAAYVASGEPFDKAGGYAIQDGGLRPVARLQDTAGDGPGCYCNVVGLPLGLLLRLLRQAGYPLPELARPQQCAGCPDW